MNDDFSEFETLQRNGFSPESVCRYAMEKGLRDMALMKMIGTVFSKSLMEAKEIVMCVRYDVKSLSKYQERLLPSIEEALDASEDFNAEP